MVPGSTRGLVLKSGQHCYNGVMAKKTQLLLVVISLGLVDAVIPFFPILALILIYVILEKPPWFLDTVQELYSAK